MKYTNRLVKVSISPLVCVFNKHSIYISSHHEVYSRLRQTHSIWSAWVNMCTLQVGRTTECEWKLIVTIQALFDFNTTAGKIILSIPWKVRVCIHSHGIRTHSKHWMWTMYMHVTHKVDREPQSKEHYMDEQDLSSLHAQYALRGGLPYA